MNNYERIIIDSNGNTEESIPAAVIDTSFFLSAVLASYTENENSMSQEFIQNLLEKNGQIIVPQLFWFETGNVLLNAVKPGKNGSPSRITKAELDAILMTVSSLPIYTDLQPDSETRTRIITTAQDTGLTYYGAAYLELARRKDVELKTWDKALKDAWERG